MVGNELQYGLIALGALLILALIGYNMWQERRARRHAEQVFRSVHRDVLLDDDEEDIIPPAPGGRMEPSLPNNALDDLELDAPQPVRSEHLAAVPASTSSRAQEPSLPWEKQAVDCAVMIEAPAGVAAASLFSAQQALLANLTKPLRWYGWDDNAHRWFDINAQTQRGINRACAVLQLTDRRGAIGQQELERFYDQIQTLCDQFLAVPRLPARAEVIERAHEADRFCSEVDIQIAVNVVAVDTSFAGTKLRGLAEAAGLVLRGDGAFHAVDDNGSTAFTLSNQEAAPFTAEQLRYLHTHGLTLMIDVPRTVNPVLAFDKMVNLAQHFADALSGQMVDDNRMPLGDRSINLIRNQIGQFEQHMERVSIPAGSEIALRLFS